MSTVAVIDNSGQLPRIAGIESKANIMSHRPIETNRGSIGEACHLSLPSTLTNASEPAQHSGVSRPTLWRQQAALFI